MLVIHTETLPHKMWPTERFISVLDKFFDAHHNYAAVVLDKADRKLDAGRHGVRVIHLPYSSVATHYAIVGLADLFLGIDSCFLHAADLFRVPGVGLFGPTNHKVFGFRFGPHRHVYSGGTMEEIGEASVLEALESMVAETGLKGSNGRE
jgi:ADP-heptose:LPS heptosyltransferase